MYSLRSLVTESLSMITKLSLLTLFIVAKAGTIGKPIPIFFWYFSRYHRLIPVVVGNKYYVNKMERPAKEIRQESLLRA